MPRIRLRILLALILVGATGAAMRARQTGSISGVVVETRTDQDDNRALFFQVEGTGTQTLDELRLDFPDDVDLPETATILPDGWQVTHDGNRVLFRGPAHAYGDWRARLDLGEQDGPHALDARVSLDDRELFSADGVPVGDLPPVIVEHDLRDNLVFPEIVAPGYEVPVGVLHPDRTPADGTWKLSLRLVPDGEFQPLPPAPTLNLGDGPRVRLPGQKVIVDDIVSGALASGFGRGQAPATGRSDDVSTADWDTALIAEEQVQTRIATEFKRITDGTTPAVTQFLESADAYKSGFTKIMSSSSDLQALMGEWPQVLKAAQNTDLALAVIQLAYGGIKGGTALYRWLARPQAAAEAVEAAAQAGSRLAGEADDLATTGTRLASAAESGAAAGPRGTGGFALVDQFNSARRGALEALAREAGVDLEQFLARFADADEAYMALVNQVARLRGVEQLTPGARQLLTRLVVAGSNARAGRAGSATAKEILQLREWAKQPGFWQRLGRAASWFEEPGRLVAKGEEMAQPALQFARDFSPEEIALLRSLAESDDVARLASRLGGVADDVPTFIDRAGRAANAAAPQAAPPVSTTAPTVRLDTPTVIDRVPRLSTSAPTVTLDTPTVITRAPAALDRSATFVDRFIPFEGATLGASEDAGRILLRGVPPAGPGATVRLTPSEIFGAAAEWETLTPEALRTLMQGLRAHPGLAPVLGVMGTTAVAGTADASPAEPMRWVRGPAGDAFAELGGLRATLRAEYTDPWGDVLVSGEKPITLAPRLPLGVMPRILDATPLAFPGKQICVCGLFPGRTGGSLLFDGEPIAPLSQSEFSSCLRVPQATTAGDHTISGDPASGFDASNTVTVGVITLSGEVDQNRLLRGQSTTLHIWLDGTTEPQPIQLRNRTPNTIALEGGEVQTVTTAGGGKNEWTGTVDAVSPGAFNIDFSIDRPTCPCADGAGFWADYTTMPTGTAPAPTGTTPDGFFDGTLFAPTGDLAVDAGIDLDFWTAVNGLHLDTALPGLNETVATRNGWHPIDTPMAAVIDRLISAGREAVALGTPIPAADVAQLREWAQFGGYFNWLAATQSGGPLGTTLRYSVEDVRFLQAVAETNGDVSELRRRLGPIKTTAFTSLVSRVTAARRAGAMADAAQIQANAAPVTGAIDLGTLTSRLWGRNDVYSAMKYYGAVDGEDPGLGSFGWALADFGYGLMTSPVETWERYGYTWRMQSDYTRFLEGSRDDLMRLGASTTSALAALGRLRLLYDSLRLDEATSVLGGASQTELRRVLDRLQRVYDQASPAWRRAHAGQMAERRSHIQTKLRDLGRSLEHVKKVRDQLPQMITWLQGLTRDAEGHMRPTTDMFNPELFIRLGATGLFLETMTSAELHLADDPVHPPKVRGPRTPDGRPMTFDQLRAAGGG